MERLQDRHGSRRADSRRAQAAAPCQRPRASTFIHFHPLPSTPIHGSTLPTAASPSDSKPSHADDDSQQSHLKQPWRGLVAFEGNGDHRDPHSRKVSTPKSIAGVRRFHGRFAGELKKYVRSRWAGCREKGSTPARSFSAAPATTNVLCEIYEHDLQLWAKRSQTLSYNVILHPNVSEQARRRARHRF